MSRRDYENDLHAPAANSLVPAASAVVVDDSGRVLLQRRRDNDMWALPGGVMDIGESLPDCAVRETREETGFHFAIVGIVGTYTNPITSSPTTMAKCGKSSPSASWRDRWVGSWRCPKNQRTSDGLSPEKLMRFR